MTYVKEHNTLDRPAMCPISLHSLMARCWSFEPEHRPAFAECLVQIQELQVYKVKRLDLLDLKINIIICIFTFFSSYTCRDFHGPLLKCVLCKFQDQLNDICWHNALSYIGGSCCSDRSSILSQHHQQLAPQNTTTTGTFLSSSTANGHHRMFQNGLLSNRNSQLSDNVEMLRYTPSLCLKTVINIYFCRTTSVFKSLQS